MRGTHRTVIGARGYVAKEIEVGVEGDERELRRTVRLDRANAVRIVTVPDRGTAKPTGVQVEDVLVRYGAKRVSNLAELKQAFLAASGVVAVELRRKGKPVTRSLPAGRLGVKLVNHRFGE